MLKPNQMFLSNVNIIQMLFLDALPKQHFIEIKCSEKLSSCSSTPFVCAYIFNTYISKRWYQQYVV